MRNFEVVVAEPVLIGAFVGALALAQALAGAALRVPVTCSGDQGASFRVTRQFHRAQGRAGFAGVLGPAALPLVVDIAWTIGTRP